MLHFVIAAALLPAPVMPALDAPALSSTAMQTQNARGTFEVKMAPLPVENAPADALLSRMSLDKAFQGDLTATAAGQMLAAGTGVENSAVYVAVERVTGTLGGKTGAFTLRHVGTMNRGVPTLSIEVVPDSGTGELAGISGSMTIRIDGKQHFYEFAYTIAK